MAESTSINDDEHTNLVAYLDGELDETAASALEAKLNLDPRVRAEANQLKRTWDLLDFLPKAEPSVDFTHRTLERVIAGSRPVSTRLRLPARWLPSPLALTWAAAILVAAVVGFGGGTKLPRQQTAIPIPEAQGEVSEEWVRDLRVMQNRRLYEQVDNFQFLQKLADPDDPDLFGDDNLGL